MARKKKDSQPIYSSGDSLSGVASSGDMTGLMPTLPRSEAEVAGYSAIAPVPLPESAIRAREERGML